MKSWAKKYVASIDWTNAAIVAAFIGALALIATTSISYSGTIQAAEIPVKAKQTSEAELIIQPSRTSTVTSGADWRSVIRSSPTPTSTPFPPDLEFVDVVLSENNSYDLTLDIKVRNIGINVAVIKRVTMGLVEIIPLTLSGYCGPPVTGGLPPSSEYEAEVSISDLVDNPVVVPISQTIAPNEADRFLITINFDLEERIEEMHFFRTNLVILYNLSDILEVESDLLFLVGQKSNQSAKLFYEDEMSDDEILEFHPYSPIEGDSTDVDSRIEKHILGTRFCLRHQLERMVDSIEGEDLVMSREAYLQYLEWQRAWEYARQ